MKDAEVGFRLEMGEDGWVDLHVHLKDLELCIMLSEVFNPFPELLAWGQKIDLGDLPIQMEIDEEGPIKVLTAIPTGDPGRVYFKISERSEQRIYMEAIVSRSAVARVLREELRRFFTLEFDDDKWTDREPDPDHPPLLSYVLEHSWLREE